MSESASASQSAANITSNNGNGSGNGSSTPSSASQTSGIASQVTETVTATTTSFNEVEDNGAAAVKKTAFNEVDDVAIDDVQVPLAVVLDDDAAAVDTTIIEDEDTPLGISKSGVGARVWWYWILIIISAISGKVAKDKKNQRERAALGEE